MTAALTTAALLKKSITESFAHSASDYSTYAHAQERSARLLANFARADIQSVVAGPILEIGCGTGIFTQHLVDLFPDRLVTASDASLNMLNHMKVESKHLEKLQLDAEQFNHNHEADDKFALIAASFSLQWTLDLYATIDNLMASLLPGGQLIFALPLSGSFPEWKDQCVKADVTCTANQLPDRLSLAAWSRDKQYTFEWTENNVTCSYASSLHFFQSLKRIGAAVNTTGKSLSMRQLRQLTNSWDKDSPEGVTVTYKVLCGRLKGSLMRQEFKR